LVRQKHVENLQRLKSFSRFRTPLVFGRGDVAEVHAYNSVMRYLIMTIIIRNGGTRTGTVQNLRLQEIAGAADDGKNKVIQIRQHKNEDGGNASIVLSQQEYEELCEAIKIREKIRCKKANKSRVFVTTGGQVFRTHNHDINL